MRKKKWNKIHILTLAISSQSCNSAVGISLSSSHPKPDNLRRNFTSKYHFFNLAHLVSHTLGEFFFGSKNEVTMDCQTTLLNPDSDMSPLSFASITWSTSKLISSSAQWQFPDITFLVVDSGFLTFAFSFTLGEEVAAGEDVSFFTFCGRLTWQDILKKNRESLFLQPVMEAVLVFARIQPGAHWKIRNAGT